jgi:ectoine hydroxylase-related dioxygenase (phytanoyl-CoA dioxygenase family)
MTGSLPASMRERYQRDGFVFPWRIMPEVEATALGQRIMAFTASETARRYDDPMNQIYLLKAHLLFYWADRIAHSPQLLDGVEQLIGGDIMVWSSGLFWKAPHSGSFVSWHQDSTNFELDDPEGVVRAWVALSPATLENGTMRFLPGAHRLGQQGHKDTVQAEGLLSRGETIDLDIDEARTVPVLIGPGEVSFHHLHTPHASGANGADIPRVNYVITYIDPRVRPRRGDDGATLARGVDRHGHYRPEARPEADFAPAAMRVHKDAMIRRNAIIYRGATPPAPPPHPI